MEQIIENQLKYRFRLQSQLTGMSTHLPFMFAEPAEARDAKVQLRAQYPHFNVDLVDREDNVVEIPKR